jgi:hypothetical protein
MVKSKKKLGLVVYKNEYSTTQFLTEFIRYALGYELSQAVNCANIIMSKGKYQVNTFPLAQIEKVKAIKQLMEEQRMSVKIISI